MTAALRAVVPEGRIGPNAVLQLVPVLDERFGARARRALFHEVGVEQLPPDTGLMNERAAVRIHGAIRKRFPRQAPELMRKAGERTADYILRHRIPTPAQAVLRLLPGRLAAPLLARAIARNAWTFTGSGQFVLVSTRPVVMAVADNPLVRVEYAREALCHWHCAVFQRLFNVLVDPRLRVVETRCCAMGDPACRFALQHADGRAAY